MTEDNDNIPSPDDSTVDPPEISPTPYPGSEFQTMSAFNTARFIYRIRNLVDDAKFALRDSEVDWLFRDHYGSPSDRCHMCADFLSLGQPGLVQFKTGQELPIHKECFQARSGLSSLGCMLSLKLGIRLVSMSMDGEMATKSERLLCEEFLNAKGCSFGEFVLGHGLEECWDGQGEIANMKDFNRWSRHIYMHQRDAPKFIALGGVIPAWDEDSMEWHKYKSDDTKKPGPFYKELKRLQDINPRGKRRQLTKKEKKEVMERTGSHCAMCSERVITEAHPSKLKVAYDHIFPHSKGGPSEVGNYQPLHNFCNGAKSSLSGGHIPLAFLMGRWFLEQLASDKRPEWWNSEAYSALATFSARKKRTT